MEIDLRECPMLAISKKNKVSVIFSLTLLSSLVAGCGEAVLIGDVITEPSELDLDLAALIGNAALSVDPTTENAGLTGDLLAGRSLPDIGDPLAQLGRDLFFTKGLGGDMEVACVTCHHPNLGGADNIALRLKPPL
jgi:cytochrome c peroxidase